MACARVLALAAAMQCAAAFSVPGAGSLPTLRSTSARAAAVPALRMQKGFGAPPPAKKVSEVAKDRKRVRVCGRLRPRRALPHGRVHPCALSPPAAPLCARRQRGSERPGQSGQRTGGSGGAP